MSTLKKQKGSEPIVDSAHLLDLPHNTEVFNVKEKGNPLKNPAAKIRILKIPHPKNGLSNLL
ncbi:hypothetical protein [Pedobacter endophyticus]|uniref:Uncharacterized protein n=1 Tax=Pedobacter endophyticus TaxID=2789740 RepID=A0A7S9L0T8_9SPHI|nr:hypothetical protein [Pedobacter endophyticus]QPH40405.1 hypothetical protein IZT61_03745 [Pedobacter endophyticus]